MRFTSFSSSSAAFARKGLLLFGCAVALSACNTTNDGKPVKTALISPQPDNSAQTVAQGAAAQGAATTQTANAADPAAPAAAGTATVADAAAAQAPAALPGTENVVSLPDPVLPAVVPVPGVRGEAQPMLAYAGAQASASPGSLATNMAFETPPSAPQNLDALIEKYSVAYDVPERLVRRVVHRESRFNPAARNGPYWGLMQISHPTARGMGYTGAPKGLLDAETNLKYAVKYLAGAYKVAQGDESQAVRYYARGYYYDAKRKGLLEEAGLKTGPRRVAAVTPAVATASDLASIPIQAPASAQ